jgi:hypothetical protein
MGKFLDTFLKFKNEADATRKGALLAVIIITFGLASLSVTGVVATAHWSWLSALPIIALVFAVLGAELLATVAFIRMLTASTMWRKVAGSFIFLGLAAIGVHNAENGAKVVWPERFAVSSSRLAAEAELAGEEAATLATAQEAAIGGTGAELERVRTQIAELRTEQQIMASMSPEGISKAQSLLLAQGLYFGSVDGIRQDKTESAMRARGEAIQGELATLRAREDGLMAGQASPVQQANTDKRLLQIENADKATAAWWAWLWLIIMLCVLESARSLSLWALITDISATDAKRDREWTDELAALRHQQERARIIAETNAAVAAYSAPPEPVAAPPVAVEPPPAIELAPEPEPAPVVTPEPEPIVLVEPAPEMTDQERRSRLGGLAAQHQRRADKAERLLVIGPVSTLDATLAAKVAAE